jgi:hypothetical protein
MPITDRDKRTLIIGSGTLGGMLLLFLLYNLLSGGGGGGGGVAVPTFNPPVSGSTAPPASPSVGPSGGPTTTPPPPIQNFSGRDPFSVPPALQSGGATSTGSSTGTATSTSTPTPTGTPSSSSPTPTSPGGGSSIVVNGHTVVLLDTFPRNGTNMAQVEVDGTVYQLSVGDTFSSGHFELRSVQGNCATFLNGDESFGLCANSSK